jgi:hypothetical protein
MIEWKLPDKLVVEAFPNQLKFIDDGNEDLQNICYLVIASETYQKFLNQLDVYKLRNSFDDFLDFDKEVSKGFVEVMNSANKQYHETREIISNNLNVTHTLESVVLEIADTSDQHILEMVFQDYNQSINIYLYARTYYTANKLRSSNPAHRNDSVDIAHLLYLGNNQNWHIVTNDLLITNLIKHIQGAKVISPEMCFNLFKNSVI